MMRIAYVTVHVAPEIMRGGVGKKIQTQISLWQEEGNQVSLFCLTPAEIQISGANQFIFESQRGLFIREIARIAALKRMLAAIAGWKPDIIYLRFGLYSFPLHRLFNIAPVVVEANSNDQQEYARRGFFFYWLNRLTRGFTINSAGGIILPTHELKKTIFSRPETPVRVISNGVDFNHSEPLPPTQNSTPVITLVGTPGMAWHGADKLFKLAEFCPDLTVNIVGYDARDIKLPVPPNLRLCGFLSKEGVRDILKDTDVACGSLAYHRIHMEEACVLKIREALAFRIPVILAYRDTDLDEITSEFILKIPNTENNILENIEKIRSFAYAMTGKRADVRSIVPRLDQRQKERMRLEFLQQILAPVR